MKYNYFKIAIDIIKGKISIKDIKNVIKTVEVLDNLKKFKIKFKDLKQLKPENVVKLVKLHNEYTTGDKIDLEEIIDNVVKVIKQIQSIANSNLTTNLLNKLIPGIDIDDDIDKIVNFLVPFLETLKLGLKNA